MATPNPPRDRGVFVPAIMGAGLLFSLAVLVLDAVDQIIGRRRRGDLVDAQAQQVAQRTLGTVATGDRPEPVVHVRRRLAVLAAVCVGVASYVAPGAWFNYVRPRGYVSEAAWVLALALAFSVSAGLVGVALGLAAWRPQRWSAPARRALQVTDRFVDAQARTHPVHHFTWGRRWHGTASAIVLVVGVTGGLWTLAVAMNARLLRRWDARWLDTLSGWDGTWAAFEPMGRTEAAAGLLVVVGVAGWRNHRRLVLAHAGAVGVGVVMNVVVKLVVDRPRPPGASASTGLASYPSGHVIQALVVAVFLTAWVSTRWRRRWLTALSGSALGASAAACALGRVSDAAHWPSDVVGGVLLGGFTAGVALLAAQPRTVPSPEPVWLWLPDRLVTQGRRWARLIVMADVVAVAVLMITVGVPSSPEATLTVERLQQGVQLGLLALVLVAWLVAWRWEAAGAALSAVAGTAMAWFAALEYRPTVAVLIAVAFLVPALLWWLSWQQGQSARALATLAVTTVVVASAVWVGASAVHDRYFGPTHPASAVVLPPVGDVRWIWTGNLSPTGFTVVAALQADPAQVDVTVIARSPSAPSVERPVVVRRGDRGIVTATFDGLTPGSDYRVAVRVDGRVDQARPARVRTPHDGPQSFTVAFGACAQTGSNGSVFDAVRAVDPLLYVITGDAHYGNVATDDPRRLFDVWERSLTSPAQQALYQQVPVAYVWDDHDYGGNDADAASPARAMAQQVYRDLVPHAPLPRVDDIGQSFVIGRVRFVLTDTRSHRVPAADGSGTLLGAQQEAWLLAEARAARDAGQLLVWVSPTPWIGAASPGSDTWAGFADERRRVADRLVADGVDDVVMLAGDAHMVAIDDGTNSGYATGGGGGFPVAHGAALDRPGSVKGGPYSEGAFPGGGQFGVMDVVDDGATITVMVSGRNWAGEVVVSHQVTFGPE